MCNMSKIKYKKSCVLDILTEKLNAELSKKTHIFRQKFKIAFRKLAKTCYVGISIIN